MLKAYDYLEYSPDRSFLQNPQHFEQELEIAQTIVNEISVPNEKVEPKCVICGNTNADWFFDKWGVNFYRCRDCESIFVYVEKVVLDQYKSDSRLIGYRTAENYQNEAAQHRDIVWDEILDWISFRTFRYKGVNKGLNISDYGNRYREFVNRIKNSSLCRNYNLKYSILNGDVIKEELSEKADIVLYLDKIQQSAQPDVDLHQAYTDLRDEGLLFLSTRMGTGFDILTLKDHAQIFPYEHVLLPSGKGLQLLLHRAGFKVLEYSTPGQMDVGYVRSKANYIDESNYFIRSLMKNADKATMGDFQRFLQRSGMSSHAHIVAKKVVNI